jgi:bisphosphoglycerate-independent phosphoglycerate mutase (AlkP superfamily)
VLGGLFDNWRASEGLILLTSDHGNMEDMTTRRHTNAKVPALLEGSAELRAAFATGLHDLIGIAPAIHAIVSLRRLRS